MRAAQRLPSPASAVLPRVDSGECRCAWRATGGARRRGTQYWTKRLASPAFRRASGGGDRRASLRAIGRQRVGQIVDPRLVRELIRHWDARVVDRVRRSPRSRSPPIAAPRAASRRTASRCVDLLDRRASSPSSSRDRRGPRAHAPAAASFITALIEREFVRGLFTDIIFTALVSFQRRANPLFGALAVRALEDQIKGFIGLFMPMLQAQAIAFAVDRANQRAVLDFARAVARQLLAMPIGRYAAAAAVERAELVRGAAARGRDQYAPHRWRVRRALLAAWDDVFAVVKNRPPRRAAARRGARRLARRAGRRAAGPAPDPTGDRGADRRRDRRRRRATAADTAPPPLSADRGGA